MVERTRRQIKYDVISNGTAVSPNDRLLNTRLPCKVLRHTAEVKLRYLVEFESGERRWCVEEKPRPKAALKEDFFEEEDEEEED